VPYGLLQEFAAAVATAQQKHNNAYRNRAGNGPIQGNVDDRDLQNAWAVYQHAAQTNLALLVLGRWVQESNEPNPGVDQTTGQNFHALSEVDYGTSVMSIQNWTLLMNDAWVLGGVHWHMPFHLATPRDSQNIVSQQYGITVAGGELIGLFEFGYEIVQAHQTPGEVARGADANAANGASFDSYLSAIENSLQNGALKDSELAQLTAPARSVAEGYY
jgi:hypothetical protein